MPTMIKIKSAVPLNLHIISTIFMMLYAKNPDDHEQGHALLLQVMQWESNQF